jgi:hypothetical protein
MTENCKGKSSLLALVQFFVASQDGLGGYFETDV